MSVTEQQFLTEILEAIERARGRINDPLAGRPRQYDRALMLSRGLRKLAHLDDIPGAGGTHAVLSATHTDTLAAAVQRGDLIVGNATPAWSRLGIGANGTALVSNGVDASWGAVTAGPHDILSVSHSDTLAAAVQRGDILIGNSTPKWARLGKGAMGTWLRSDGTDPAWQAIDHGADLVAGSLLDDDHTQYLLLAGRSPKQTLRETGSQAVILEILDAAGTTSYVLFRGTGRGASAVFEVANNNVSQDLIGLFTGGYLKVSYGGGSVSVKPNGTTTDFVGAGFGSGYTFDQRVQMPSLRLPGGSDPTLTDTALWASSTQRSLYAYPSGIKQTLDGSLFVQTAGVTLANSVVETTLLGAGVGSVTLPTNFFTAGKSVVLIAHGFYGCLAAATMRLRAYMTDTTPTTVTLADTTAGTLATASTNKSFALGLVVTCRTLAGAASVGQAQLLVYFEGNQAFPQAVNTATFTFDATKAQTLDLKGLWGAASATNTITVSNLKLRVEL